MATKAELSREKSEEATSAVSSAAQGTVAQARSVAGNQIARQTRKETVDAGKAIRRERTRLSVAQTEPAIGNRQIAAHADAMTAKAKVTVDSASQVAKPVARRTAISTVKAGAGAVANSAKAGAGAVKATATATRDASGRFVKAAATNVADTARGVGQAQTVAGKVQRGLGAASPYLLAASGVVAASSAFNAAKAAGGSDGAAAGAAAVASAPAVAAGLAPTLIGRYAPKLAAGLAKAALPLTIASAAVGAVRGGYEEYAHGGSAGSVAGHAALGAADALTFGLASHAYNKLTGNPAQPLQPIGKPAPSFAATVATQAGRDRGQPASGQTIVARPAGPQATPTANRQGGKAQAAPSADPRQPAAPKPDSSRMDYTLANGKMSDKGGTKAQIEAWQKRRLAA